jgi:ATP-dependent phosphoenolpyruvate carboxykinase
LKHVNPLFTITGGCLAINTAVLEAPKAKVVVKNVQQSSHLTEDENLKALFEELWQQQVQDLELHASVHQVFTVNKGWTRLDIFKEVGVVADFL